MSISISARLGDGGVQSALEAIVQEYHQRGDVPRLLESLAALAASASTADLVDAVRPYREMHEVAGPIYEVVVEREPHDAAALVALANAYWLTGRGPEVVGDLASRALTADASNRGAWHLWALSEPSPRLRVQRWQQVSVRFPSDDLAKASLADNAASLAGAAKKACSSPAMISRPSSRAASASISSRQSPR
jgi:hypothetical protein